MTNGRIELAAPAEWPDGMPVRIVPASEPVSVGVAEEHWPTDPESIAAWVAAVDALEPMLTPEEDAAWGQALAEQNAWELAHQAEYDAKIDRLFR